MEEEIDNMNLAGWTTNFIYEEFYPNHDYDIKGNIEDFLRTLFNKSREYCDVSLANTIFSHEGSEISASEAKTKLISFTDSIASAKLLKLEFSDNEINEECALQKVFVEYDRIIQVSGDLIKYKGEGIFNFVVMSICIISVGLICPDFKFD